MHVPDMGLLVAGDVVYNGVHLYLTESDGIAGIDEWLAALDTAEALRPATVIAGHKDPSASTIHHRSRQHGAISPTRADCLSRRNRPTSSTRRCCVCTLGESTRARYGAQQSLCFPRSARPRLRRSSMLGAPFDRADDPARNKPRALGYELTGRLHSPDGSQTRSTRLLVVVDETPCDNRDCLETRR